MSWEINGGNANAQYTLTEQVDNQITYLNLHVVYSGEEIPCEMTISKSFSNVDCFSTWSPAVRYSRYLLPEWIGQKTDSRLASQMPLHQIVSMGGRNRICLAISDAATPIQISTGVREDNGEIKFSIHFFTILTAPRKEYHVRIRLDQRDVAYYESIYDTVAWWENDCGYKPLQVPEAARLPLDSLWYSFHQDLDAESIVKECEESARLGMKTVIIDDGWQTDNNYGGYSYCGDWEVSAKKMGDMKALVDRIHALGMKVMVWFSVPYIGINAKRYSEFSDMLLDNTGDKKTYFCLDPRYEKVRKYLVDTYTKAVSDWGLDGLKLDFIDRFSLGGKSLENDARRDYCSLEDGLDALMMAVTEALSQINPEILIEFRQTYVGPSIRKYGNMLRVYDCPGDSFKNRQDVITLRLTSGNTAVHSDMIMWCMKDSAASAALQFANIIYAVPQISVRIEQLSDEHKRMLQHYLNIWMRYREVLLDGKFTADNPESGYSQARAQSDVAAVVSVYTNPLVEAHAKETVVVNASEGRNIILQNAIGQVYEVMDCCGNIQKTGIIHDALEAVYVEMSGMIHLYN